MSAGPSFSQIAQQSNVQQTMITPKQIRTKDADESRRSEQQHVDDEDGHGPKAGSGKEKAAAETAAFFQPGDKAKHKKRKAKVGGTGATGGKTTRKSAGTGSTQQSQEQQQNQKSDGARGRGAAGPGSGYSAEHSRALATKQQTSQASLQRASIQFDSSQRAQGNDANPLSAAGQRRMMLEQLSRMVKISLEQHTGGTAGEAYPRRETRQIFSALEGLKSGGQTNSGTKDRRTDTRMVSNGEFKLKESRMNNVLAIFLDPTPPPEGHEPLELVA